MTTTPSKGLSPKALFALGRAAAQAGAPKAQANELAYLYTEFHRNSWLAGWNAHKTPESPK